MHYGHILRSRSVLFQPIYLTFEEDDRVTALELQTEKDNNESCVTQEMQEKTRATGEL